MCAIGHICCLIKATRVKFHFPMVLHISALFINLIQTMKYYYGQVFSILRYAQACTIYIIDIFVLNSQGAVSPTVFSPNTTAHICGFHKLWKYYMTLI